MSVVVVSSGTGLLYCQEARSVAEARTAETGDATTRVGADDSQPPTDGQVCRGREEGAASREEMCRRRLC